MPHVVLPGPLDELVGGADRLEVGGESVGQALRTLEDRHPSLRGWVLDDQGMLREHVGLFVGGRRADLETAIAASDEVWVVRAISGGSSIGTGASSSEVEVLVGTCKGLFVLRGPREGELRILARRFEGQDVEYAIRDPRSGRTFAAVTHGQFGPRLFFTDDDPATGEWEQAEGPAFPPEAGASVERIWIVRPGAGEGELWAGVAPAALFHSRDGGRTWSLVEALWNHPTRAEWEGGAGGLCLHSICPWPGDPGRLAVGISAAGVWLTEDGGASWERGGRGLVARYLPEEARADTLMLCVHHMERCPTRPERLWLQFHGGVYLSDDAGRLWREVGGGLPADFGFPLVIDPRDPERAFVIPLASDLDRVTPDGSVRVFETRDGGAEWAARDRGLPQDGAWLTILRQAFATDGGDPLGLWFGAKSGELFGSTDGGETWRTVAERLPTVLAVTATGRGR